MGIGHAAVALASSRTAPRLNVGVLIFAAFLADFLLGIFASLGLESAHVPADYASRHYLTFTFPYSHGLVPLLLWAALLGILFCWLDRQNRLRAFIVISALVLSHYLLDGLVHVAGLPLLGENSPKLGLALWKHMPAELTLETVIAAVGLAVYWKLSPGTTVGRWGVAIFVVLLTVLTWTQLFSTTPPAPSQLQWSWIFAPLIFSAIPYFLDRGRVAALAR